MSTKKSSYLAKVGLLSLMLLLASGLAACGDKTKSDAELIASITAEANATGTVRPAPVATSGSFTSLTLRPDLLPVTTAAATTPSVSDSSTAVKVGVTTGSTPPEINVVDIDGKTFRLSDFRNNKAVLLNFWGVD